MIIAYDANDLLVQVLISRGFDLCEVLSYKCHCKYISLNRSNSEVLERESASDLLPDEIIINYFTICYKWKPMRVEYETARLDST